MAAKEDQIVWTVFSVFWAANTVLLVGLFATGKCPRPIVGIVISIGGVFLSLLWFFIQKRAISWLAYYERIIEEIEQNYLNLPKEIALTGQLNERLYNEIVGQHVKARRLMITSGCVAAILWAMAFVWFLIQAVT